jgi:hypothetical protein
MCSEIVVSSVRLLTRWMSPGGAKPVTDPIRLALWPMAASHRGSVRTSLLPDSIRYVLGATYGAPPEQPATAALLDALADAAAGWRA